MKGMSKQTPRITISLTAEEFHAVHEMAFRTGSSVSQLGQWGLVRLLNDIETGKVPILAEFDNNTSPGHA